MKYRFLQNQELIIMRSDSCSLKRGPKIFLNVLNPKNDDIKVKCLS